jgi:peptidyl-prolyl cis-trans isomerase C
MKNMLRHWLREPLVHFLIAGFGVFLIASWRGEPVDPASRTITIDATQISRLAESWSQTWQRPPTQTEIDGLIRDHIKEEVYYREAKRAGLDADDAVIRRRLRSKMEFLASEAVESSTPDEAVLQAWLHKNVLKYTKGAATSFDQIYLRDDKSSAARLLQKLGTGADWQEMGHAISLPKSLEGVTPPDIARDFGDDFATSIAGLKPGGWTGPIASGFGQHLVRVRSLKIPPPPKLADIRQQVENDWRATTLKEREAEAYQFLLDQYVIKIDRS